VIPTVIPGSITRTPILPVGRLHCLVSHPRLRQRPTSGRNGSAEKAQAYDARSLSGSRRRSQSSIVPVPAPCASFVAEFELLPGVSEAVHDLRAADFA